MDKSGPTDTSKRWSQLGASGFSTTANDKPLNAQPLPSSMGRSCPLSQNPKPRKLATIRRISAIKKIKGYNRNSLAMIDGWSVVVLRGDFEAGDLVVYFEIDSFLPTAHGAFWENCASWDVEQFDGESGYVLRTRLMCGHISQGLIYPLNAFSATAALLEQAGQQCEVRAQNQVSAAAYAFEDLVGKDVSAALGIKKYEIPSPSSPEGHDKYYGYSPIFFPQPGCDRAQNIPCLFLEHGHKKFLVTEKLDGVPMTLYRVAENTEWFRTLPHDEVKFNATHDEGSAGQPKRPNVGVCSRMSDLVETEKNIFWSTARAQGLFAKMAKIGIPNVALQGELCGSDVLENTMGFAEGDRKFYVFGIYNIDRQKWFPQDKTADICRRLDVSHVPVIARTSLYDFAKDIDELFEKAERRGALGQMSEGLIFRTLDNEFQFKVIANSWLLKYGNARGKRR